MLYQTSAKYRDEKRIRTGVLRSKEFYMTDLYSFDRSLDEAYKTFDIVDSSFRAIFGDLEIPIEPLEAENGIMGGSRSKEYQCCCGVGEDRIVECRECGYKALHSISRSQPKKLAFFESKSFDHLRVELDSLNTRNDFLSFVNSHDEIRSLLSVYIVRKGGFTKQVVIPRGRYVFVGDSFPRELSLSRLSALCALGLSEEDVEQSSSVDDLHDVCAAIVSFLVSRRLESLATLFPLRRFAARRHRRLPHAPPVGRQLRVRRGRRGASVFAGVGPLLRAGRSIQQDVRTACARSARDDGAGLASSSHLQMLRNRIESHDGGCFPTLRISKWNTVPG